MLCDALCFLATETCAAMLYGDLKITGAVLLARSVLYKTFGFNFKLIEIEILR